MCGRCALTLHVGCLQIIVDNDQARVKDGLPVEAHITAGLNHRNVVRTIAHAWRPLVSHVSASMSVWDSAGSNAVGPFTACNEGETWLLLELCDKGTLQVIPCSQLDALRVGGRCAAMSDHCLEDQGTMIRKAYSLAVMIAPTTCKALSVLLCGCR